VLGKIGRNVLLFRQIEGLLEFLVANRRAGQRNNWFRGKPRARAENFWAQVMGKPSSRPTASSQARLEMAGDKFSGAEIEKGASR